jgi:hypothetical protein
MKRIIFFQKNSTVAEGIKRAVSDKTRIEVEWIDSQSDIDPLALLLDRKPIVIVTEFPQIETNRLNVRNLKLNLLNGVHLVCCLRESEVSKVQARAGLGDWIYTVLDKDLFLLTGQLLALTDELPEGQFYSGIRRNDEVPMTFPLFLQSYSYHGAVIESSIHLSSGQELEESFPLNPGMFYSTAHKVKGSTELTTRSHLPFSYNVVFSYCDQLLEAEKMDKLIANCRYDLAETDLTEEAFAVLDSLLLPPKSLSLISEEGETDEGSPEQEFKQRQRTLKNLCRALTFESVFSKANNHDVISIYQTEMRELKLRDGRNFELRRRPKILNPTDDILRDRPSIIVVEYSRENNFSGIKDLVSATVQFNDYFPYLVIFNFDEMPIKTLRDRLEYHFVVAAKFKLEESFILSVLNLYRQKQIEKKNKKIERTYKEIIKLNPLLYNINQAKAHLVMVNLDPGKMESYWFQSMNIRLKRLGAYTITIESEVYLTAGAIIGIESPFKMQLYILGNDKEANTYLGLIHMISSSQRSLYITYIDEI